MTKEMIDDVLAKQFAKSSLSRYAEDHGENRSSASSATDPYANNQQPVSSGSEDAEVSRLKIELEMAKERMAQMDLQLTQSRLAQHTMEEAIGSPFPTAQHLAANISTQVMLPGANAGGLVRPPSTTDRPNFNLPPQA